MYIYTYILFIYLFVYMCCLFNLCVYMYMSNRPRGDSRAPNSYYVVLCDVYHRISIIVLVLLLLLLLLPY